MPIISVKNIGKKYNITHQQGPYVTLRDVITNVIKSPFSFLKAKAKSVAGISKNEEFWALRNINFEVEKGEVIGIIGRNGAGKSTLLKILSQITPPTEGEIVINGRVGSLLEVGTGFHPELTGRENIFLNGAILGMARKDIIKKFDDIVAFAGIDKFLDTPVKHYSSGMYVRLAFSVAAHMEPDILIVDEVLAVGDAEFQKKCLGKMEDITKNEGRTVIFVSHNMAAIKQLCTKCVLLEKGSIKAFDSTDKVINLYLENGMRESQTNTFAVDENKDASITKIFISNSVGKTSSSIPIDEKFFVNVEFICNKPITDTALCIIVYSHSEMLLFSSESDKTGQLLNYNTGTYSSKIEIPPFLFNVGHFHFEISIQKPSQKFFDRKENLMFEIVDKNNPRSAVTNGNVYGVLGCLLNFEQEKIK